MSPSITVFIPTFNRPELLKTCLDSVLAQSFGDIAIVVLDNASDIDYSEVLASTNDERILYQRNKTNLGSIGNIALALSQNTNSEFVVVFHDDDLMHPDMLRLQLEAMRSDSGVAFIGTLMKPFDADAETTFDTCTGKPVIFPNSSALARAFLGGLEMPFGSILYRASTLSRASLRVGEYSILADRPFLLDLAETERTAVVPCPLVHYRRHASQDSRSMAVDERNVLALFKRYAKALDLSSKKDAHLLYSQIGREAIPAHRRLPTDGKTSLISFLKRCREEDVLRYRFLLLYLKDVIANR